MRAVRLRQALASLYENLHRSSPTLSADAERAIRRRAARPWLVGAAWVVVGVLVGVAARAAIDGSESAAGSQDTPTAATMPSPEAIPAVAHIPLAGGPQFVHPWGELTCGDPAPAPSQKAPDQRLSFDLTKRGSDATVTGSLTWSAPDKRSTTRREPVISVGPTLIVAVRDGIVAGMRPLLAGTLGWQQHGKDVTATAPVTPDSVQFSCVTFDERTQEMIVHRVTLDPGTYEVYAVTRAWATPESVALFQAVADTDLNMIAEGLRQQGETYLPGSAACQALIEQNWAVRACLPDVIPAAAIDKDAGTVDLLYDASALPQEFDVILVSEPVEMVFE